MNADVILTSREFLFSYLKLLIQKPPKLERTAVLVRGAAPARIQAKSVLTAAETIKLATTQKTLQLAMALAILIQLRSMMPKA